MLSRDLLYAFRSLRNQPVFALTAIATIGLGIGACTAIFSVAHAVLLRPLPYKDPDRLVLACSDLQRRNVKDFPVSNADFVDIRNGGKRSFEDLAAVNTGRALITGRDGTPEQIRVAAVSTNFFHMMGIPIGIGREFTEAEGTGQPAPPAAAQAAPVAQLPVYAILSHEYFQRRFSGDPSILGRPLPLIGGPAPIVVGVSPPGVELLFPPQAGIERSPDIWFAARIAYDQAARNDVQWRVIGRLKANASMASAQGEMDAVAAQLQSVNAIARTAGQQIRLEPMKQHLVSEVRPAITALSGTVLFLLLIACANVANLMLVRSALRERELAVRTALGGSWWQLVHQLLVEAAVISGLGTLLGVALAWIGLNEMLRLAPENLPRLDAVRIDPMVLLFSVIAGVLAAALFGIVPAWRAARPDINTILRTSGRNASLGGTGLLRNGVVVLEVALSFVLLIGSGLMFRSFLAIQRVDLGFDSHHLLTFRMVGNPGDTPEARAAFVRQIDARLAAIPGVQSVGAALTLPLAAPFNPIRWGTAEALSDESKFRAADLQIVRPGYFETMRMPLLAGRTFTEADNRPDRNLVIIDEALAAKAFGREPAVGKRILYRVLTPKAQWGEVVGVVKHQRDTSLAEAGREQLYIADGYVGHGAVGWWALRTAGSPGNYAARVREEMRLMGGKLLVDEVQPMDALVEKAQAGTRFSLVLIGAFAVAAGLLTAVGMYGVLSTLVRQRTAEIGVRMAMGAAPSGVFGLVVGQGLRLSLLGISAGVLAALGLTRLMQSMLVEVKPTDPLTYVTIAVVFLCISVFASWAPARRAAGLDPARALRDS